MAPLGNDADESRSDTWHYIRTYLEPLLAPDPDLLYVPAFQRMLGEHIGASNRFLFMDSATGRITIINRDHGVDHMGAWLSDCVGSRGQK